MLVGLASFKVLEGSSQGVAKACDEAEDNNKGMAIEDIADGGSSLMHSKRRRSPIACNIPGFKVPENPDLSRNLYNNLMGIVIAFAAFLITRR